MSKIFLLALAGAMGTLARYGLGGAFQRLGDAHFPIGTAVVNIAGCLLFGLVWSWSEGRLSVDSSTRAVIFIGFFGAFTTFSSFAYETSALLQDAQWLAAFWNIALQNCLGLVGMLIGLALGKLLV